MPWRTDEAWVELIASLRRLRTTGAEIAERLGTAPSTLDGILTRIGLGKLSRWRHLSRRPTGISATGRAS